ncbi:MAG: prolyl oligopeptidase family serine peptidase [Planctomycetes bacterium]|nr:prolyl oligopeptidase family serine peptidase [Planctomycetota bacterium]
MLLSRLAPSISFLLCASFVAPNSGAFQDPPAAPGQTQKPGATGKGPKTWPKRRGAGQTPGGAAPAGGATAPANPPAPAAQPPVVPVEPVVLEVKPPRELKTLVPSSWLVIEATDESGRRSFQPDAVFAKYLAMPSLPMPTLEDALSGETLDARRWTERASVEDVLQGEFGYAFTTVQAEDDGVWLASLAGASALFVNGVGFVGDDRSYGITGVPVLLRKGPNHVFVRGRRSDVRLVFREPEAALTFAPWGAVVPDLVAGREVNFASIGAIVVVNATQERTRLAELSLASPDGYFKEKKFPVPPMAPLSIRTAWFTLDRRAPVGLEEKATTHELQLGLAPRGSKPFTTTTLTIAVRGPGAARRATFGSGVDGSIQTFAVLPPTDPLERNTQVVLSLHGANVDALDQVQSYASKSGLWIVAPTNRRPFGFDWQDWGHDDAYEALGAALTLSGGDPQRVFLTGHSMGGHGTWHLGATDPWRFAAIAPSAGWSSFDTYGGRPETELAWLWRTADAASRTEDQITNLVATPTYILHGEADDNVPSKESHDLEAALVKAGGAPKTHYQTGAGHWWDDETTPGVDCLDWAGIFDLFRSTPRRVLAPHFDFTSVDPSVNASYGPLVLDQPLEYGVPMRVVGDWAANDGRLSIRTTNVRRLRVDFSKIESVALRVKLFDLDGQVFDVWNDLRREQVGDPTWFVREVETWAQDATREHVALASTWRAFAADPSPRFDGEKNSKTCGPFKRAFAHNFVLVYGTAGSPQESKTLFDRARYDQETWWYRANGTPALFSDVDYLAEEAKGDGPTTNVILYGNSHTNAAWSKLVPADLPIRVKPGSIELGAQRWTGNDLAALFVAPRADIRRDRPPYRRAGDKDAASEEVPAWPMVGVIADTGIAGSRLGYQLRLFTSGVGYPDYTVFSSEVSRSGDGGVLAAGWFDQRWRLQPGGFLRTSTSTDQAR